MKGGRVLGCLLCEELLQSEQRAGRDWVFPTAIQNLHWGSGRRGPWEEAGKSIQDDWFGPEEVVSDSTSVRRQYGVNGWVRGTATIPGKNF